jgi:CHASE2 domain-containing sensor protein
MRKETAIRITRAVGIPLLLSGVGSLIGFGLPEFFLPSVFNDLNDDFIEHFCNTNVSDESTHSRDKRLVIVDIDHKTCALLGRAPTYRDIAVGVEQISLNRPATILLDISLDYPQNKNDDSAAAAIFARIPNLGFTGSLVKNRDNFPRHGIDSALVRAIDRFALPLSFPADMDTVAADYVSVPLPQFLANGAYFGFVDCFYDRNLRLSTSPLLHKYKGKVYPSAVLSVLASYYCLHLANGVLAGNGVLTIGKESLHYKETGFRYTPQGPDQTFFTIPFYRIREMNPESFAGKIVLVGRSSMNLDFHPVRSRQVLFGTEIIANILHCILSRKSVLPVPLSRLLMLSICIGFLTSLAAISRFYLVSPVVLILFIMGVVVGAKTAFDYGYEMEVAGVLLSVLTSTFLGFMWQILELRRAGK